MIVKNHKNEKQIYNFSKLLNQIIYIFNYANFKNII